MKQACQALDRTGADSRQRILRSEVLQGCKHLRIRCQSDGQMSGDLFAFFAHPLLEFVGAQRVSGCHVAVGGDYRGGTALRQRLIERHFALHRQVEGGGAEVFPDSPLAQLLGAQRSGHAEPGQEAIRHIGRGGERRPLRRKEVVIGVTKQRRDRRGVEFAAQSRARRSSRHQLPLVVAHRVDAAWESRRARRCSAIMSPRRSAKPGTVA